jgi:flavin-dependent amine oxidoreductase
MELTRKEALKLAVAGAGTALAGRVGAAAEEAAHRGDSVITRDVAIIGGGASGTYSAIRLRDLGKSVIVVEADDRLGGHTHTYTDPATGGTVDLGVLVWHDLDIVRDFLARFDVPVAKASFESPGMVTKYVDFRTGKEVAGYAPGDPSAGLAAYTAQLAKYPYLEQGYDLPDPVPADLLLRFGDFARKYELDTAVVRLIFNLGQGLGDFLNQPTLYVMKIFGLDLIRNLSVGFIHAAGNDNSELYTKALEELGDDVLLRSHVVATDRDAHGYVKVRVATPTGARTIRAKKLLLTIPPKLRNLAAFDLDRTERSLFGQFVNTGYYTGVLRESGLPDNYAVENVGADTPYHLPVLPGTYGISPTGLPGLHNIKYGSPNSMSLEQVKADIVASLARIRAAGTLPTTPPEFAVFSGHDPFELTVPVQAIKAGFYRDLYALQGHNRTFYTGATFHSHNSSLLWQFTEALLPRIAA